MKQQTKLKKFLKILGGIFETNKIRQKISFLDTQIATQNFWQDNMHMPGLA